MQESDAAVALVERPRFIIRKRDNDPIASFASYGEISGTREHNSGSGFGAIVYGNDCPHETGDRIIPDSEDGGVVEGNAANGVLALKGRIHENQDAEALAPSEDGDFIVRRSEGSPLAVARFDAAGDLYLAGRVHQYPYAPQGETGEFPESGMPACFTLKTTSGDPFALFTDDGHLYLRGAVFQGTLPDPEGGVETLVWHEDFQALLSGLDDWKKNARLGTNTDVADAFRAEIKPETGNRIYRLETHMETELGGCQPYRIYAEGAEWLRFLPNGNLIITKGQPHASWSNWSTTGPLAQPPVFAIVDPRGRALLVVDRDSGDMYTRLAIHTGQSSIEASGFYYTANDAVLMRLTNTGEMFLRGVVKAGTQPTSQQWSEIFPGSYRGDGCEQEGEIEGEGLNTSCNCFEGTPWFVLHPCEYP